MKVLCDIDGVLADYTGHLVAWLAKRGVWHPTPDGVGRRFTVEDFRSYDLASVVPKRDLLKLPSDKQFVHSIPEYPGAQQFLKDVLGRGHDLTLVTAPWLGPYHEFAREEWVRSILSFPAGRAVGFRWATPEQRVEFDDEVLVEDRHETAQAWAETGRPCVLVERPWNRDYARVANVHRVGSYIEALHVLDLLELEDL